MPKQLKQNGVDIMPKTVLSAVSDDTGKNLMDILSDIKQGTSSGLGAPEYASLGLNNTATDIYSGGVGNISMTGYKYGKCWGFDAAGNANIYINPTTGVYVGNSPVIDLYATQGTLKLTDAQGTVKSQVDVDMCGNDTVYDQIEGITLIRRWSDTIGGFPANKYTWVVGETGESWDIFLLKMSDSELGKIAKRFTPEETANVVSNCFRAVSYNTLLTATKICMSMHWSEEDNKHIIAFKIPAKIIVGNAYVSAAQAFGNLFNSKSNGWILKIRYELADPMVENLYIPPYIINEGDTFTFEPLHTVTAHDSTTLTSSPKTFSCNVYANAAAKVKGDHEQDTLMSLINRLLGGADSGNNTMISEAEPGSDLTSILQKEAAGYNQTGGTIYLKNGSYTASGQIDIPGDVTIIGLGTVKITSSVTDKPVFYLRCGACLDNVQIVVPNGYTSAAVLVGSQFENDIVSYLDDITNIKNVSVKRTVPSGDTTVFTGYGIKVYVSGAGSTVYHVNIDNAQVYNFEYGIWIGSTAGSEINNVATYVANTSLSHIYTHNCYIGIRNNGNSTTAFGYTVQTSVNNLYGIETVSGYWIGGHVYDCDLYYDGDVNRANIGHPKYGYHITGTDAYIYITDPIFTEYQGKYGALIDAGHIDQKFEKIGNTWGRYRQINETHPPLKLNGNDMPLNGTMLDFNGMIDNAIAFADTKWTVTHNITESDVVSGKISSVFDPNIGLEHPDALVLKNRPADNPYVITVDLGTFKYFCAAGIAWHCVPRLAKIEAWYDKWDTTRDPGLKWSDDNFLEIYSEMANRDSVLQKTWSGTTYAPAQKLRFTFADCAPTTNIANPNLNIMVNNIFAYRKEQFLSDVYLPSSGGHIYNGGGITVDPGKVFADDELVPKKYVASALVNLMAGCYILDGSQGSTGNLTLILDPNGHQPQNGGMYLYRAVLTAEGQNFVDNITYNDTVYAIFDNRGVSHGLSNGYDYLLYCRDGDMIIISEVLPADGHVISKILSVG